MALPSLVASAKFCSHSPFASEWIPAICKRHQSTFRRTRKALKVKPDPSFLPTKTEKHDHIIFNPPSSMPSVYQTPSKFLPAGDPRRIVAEQINAAAAATSQSSTKPTNMASTLNGRVPKTIVHQEPTKPYNVTPEQVKEIRQLHKEDPVYWTRVRLSKKFECSTFFITLCVQSPEAAARHTAQLEAIKAKWGRARTIAKEAKYERQKLWGSDY